MQKSYHTIDEHKAGMRKHMKGWNSPHLEKLISATQPDAMLLSHIYQRQVLLRRRPAILWNALSKLGGPFCPMILRANTAA